MRWTSWSGLAATGGLVVLLGAGIQFSPELFGVSDCPVLARVEPVRVALASDTDFVELDRQPDLGYLPSYRLRVRGDGHVDWEGRRCVAAPGYRRGQIDPESAKVLIERFEARGFCRLCGHYWPEAEHADTTRLALSLGDQRRDVVNESLDPPEAFVNMAEDMEQVPLVAEWIGQVRSGECSGGRASPVQ